MKSFKFKKNEIRSQDHPWYM